MTRRREFLSAAGAAAVYNLAAAQTAPSPKPVSANDTVTLGFVGVGIRGTQLMHEFSEVPGVRIVSVADVYDGHLTHAREVLGDKIQTTRRYEDVFGRQDIDAVVVATPDHWHKRMTLDALSAGKHIYIEKPLTWSLEEGPELIAAEKRSGKVVMVGSGGKTSAMTQKVKDLIASNTIGKVMLVRMVNHRNSAEGAWVYPVPPDASPKTIDWDRFIGPAPQRSFDPEVFFRWRCWWEYSGGVATDLFVHLLTTLHEVMQVEAPVSVVSQGGLWFWKDGRTVPDVLESVFEYREGFLAQMCVNLKNSGPTSGTRIYGSEGTIVWEPRRIMVYPEPEDRDVQLYGINGWPKAMREQYLKSKGVDPANPRAGWPERPQPKPYTVERGPGHVEYFVQSIRESKPSRENATEGHAAAGAAHLANKAYREGRRMKWEFESNRITAS